MPKVAPHHHPCQICHAKTECGGTWEENWDGFPDVICREFHQAGGFVNPDFSCEDCEALTEAEQETILELRAAARKFEHGDQNDDEDEQRERRERALG